MPRLWFLFRRQPSVPPDLAMTTDPLKIFTVDRNQAGCAGASAERNEGLTLQTASCPPFAAQPSREEREGWDTRAASGRNLRRSDKTMQHVAGVKVGSRDVPGGVDADADGSLGRSRSCSRGVKAGNRAGGNSR